MRTHRQASLMALLLGQKKGAPLAGYLKKLALELSEEDQEIIRQHEQGPIHKDCPHCKCYTKASQ